VRRIREDSRQHSLHRNTEHIYGINASFIRCSLVRGNKDLSQGDEFHEDTEACYDTYVEAVHGLESNVTQTDVFCVFDGFLGNLQHLRDCWFICIFYVLESKGWFVGQYLIF